MLLHRARVTREAVTVLRFPATQAGGGLSRQGLRGTLHRVRDSNAPRRVDATRPELTPRRPERRRGPRWQRQDRDPSALLQDTAQTARLVRVRGFRTLEADPMLAAIWGCFSKSRWELEGTSGFARTCPSCHSPGGRAAGRSGAPTAPSTGGGSGQVWGSSKGPLSRALSPSDLMHRDICR